MSHDEIEEVVEQETVQKKPVSAAKSIRNIKRLLAKKVRAK